MKKFRLLFVAACLPLVPSARSAEPPSPYAAGASVQELPEISIVVNAQGDLTDPEDPDRHQKMRIKEAEFAISGAIYPSIKGDFIAAFEQEYVDREVETEADVEEAYLTFLELPGGLQATAGRKLLGFGRLNTVHSHHWSFSEAPLVMKNFLGDHAWFDDGLEASYLIPNPADLYLKLAVGVWNGRALAHSRGEDDEAEDEQDPAEDPAEQEEQDHEHGETIEWDGQLFTGRLFADLPMGDAAALQLGYSLGGDEAGRSLLQGADLVVRHQAPGSYRKTKWHTEFFFLDDDVRDLSPMGLFSVLTFAPDRYWETGVRGDYAEMLDDASEDATAGSAFVTRYLTHTTYLRLGYQHTEYSSDEHENEHLASAQLVWGLGPHSHRLAD